MNAWTGARRGCAPFSQSWRPSPVRRPGALGDLPGPATAVMARYARELGEEPGGQEIRAAERVVLLAPTTRASREALEAQIPQVAELGFKTLQIDDGWEVAVGDWEAGELRRRHGDRRDPDRESRHAAGPGGALHRPASSRAVPRYPEMFVTAPTVDWLRGRLQLGRRAGRPTPPPEPTCASSIAKIVHRWGFSYLKLRLHQCRRHRLSASPDKPGRNTTAPGWGSCATRPRRDLPPGVGSSSCPLHQTLDAVQVGPDVAPMWENYAADDLSDAKAYNALHAGINRLWLGAGHPGVDPDVVFFPPPQPPGRTQMQWLRDIGQASLYQCLSDPD